MRLHKLLGVAGLTFAASCAVLTVDVDVYKGPMANETDVQAQQLTAMAVAARPLLIQLRDQLEVEHRKLTDIEELPATVRSKEYIGNESELRNPQARVVNAVLGLYMDKMDEGIAPFVGKGNALFEECSRLRQRMTHFDKDRRLWARVPRPTDKDAELAKIHKAFEALLVVDKKLPDPDPSDRKFLAAAKLISPHVRSANAACAVLSDPPKVLEQISQLTKDPELQRELTARVTEIAQAYLLGRSKLDEALQLALSFHIVVATREASFPNRSNILQSNAKVIALLLQPQTLSAVRTDQAGPRLLTARLVSLLAALPAPLGGGGNWKEDSYSLANQALAAVLVSEPVVTASALLNAHRDLRSATPPVTLESRPSEDLTYGLARALTFDEEARIDIRKAFAQFQSTLASIGDVGLDGGRLERGLLSMIEDYLAARDEEQKLDARPMTSRIERRRLNDGLLHFAQKVLFIVQHDTVLRSAEDEERESYVMVLQSIGNSILTLANEEFHRDGAENKDTLEKQASLLSAAVTSAWTIDADRGFRELRDLLSSGEGFHDDLSTELKDARTALDTAVKERDEALKIAEAAVVAKRRKAVEEAKRKAAWWEAKAPTTENQKLRSELQGWRNSTGSNSRGKWFEALAELDAVKNSDLAADLIELRRSMTDTSAEEAKDAWKALDAAIRARVSAAEALASAKFDVRKDAPTAELEAKDKAVATAQAEHDAKRSSSIASSRTALEDSAGRVLARLAASATPTDALQFRRELMHQLDRDARAKTAADAAPYDIARKWLEKLPASTAVKAPIVPVDAQEPAEVFDQIIASLEQQRTSMMARGVLTQERREQLDRALELAIASRSASIYIRPPWAYLRNATPISAVQETSVGWQNMVAKHGGRALASNGTRPGDKRVERDIDQQFWQNINRVRVAGMGNTSYVLAKDDIGNWYVKGYSGDPKPVFEGLQAMALAAQSGSMGVDLFKRGDALREAAETGEPVDPGESATLVGKQAQHFEKLYGEDAKEDSKAARDAHAALVKDVRDAWAKLPEWKTEDAAPLTRTRQELEGDLEATLAKLADAPDAKANAAALSTDVLTVLAKSLDTQEAALARLDEAKLVSRTELTALEAELSKSVALAENARREVELAEARLEAIQALDGALKSDIDKATKALGDNQARANELATSEAQARAARDAEAERVAAATRLVAGLRAAVLEIVGGGVSRRIERRRASSERYSQAIQVLSSSASSGD